MSVGKEAGEFSFTSTGVTASSTPDGGASSQVNVEGTATGFGAVIGTLTLYAAEAGSDKGFVTWAGTGYLDSGETAGGQGRGVFEKSGTHKWRVRLVIQITDGPLLLTDGEMSLEGRSYSGTIHQWE
jgi:hypothetical protein